MSLILPFFSFLLLFIFQSTPLLAADESVSTTLSEEQKIEKRLLFNQYVEDQLEQAKKKKYADQAQAPKKTFINRVSTAYGYDSNVNLNSSHRGDGFSQTTLEGSYDILRPESIPIPWPGRIGLIGYTELLVYDNMERSNYNTTTMTAFTEEKLLPQLTLKVQYDLNLIRYMENDQLSYRSHKLKPTLTHYLTEHFSHNVYVSYEMKDFTDRKKLSETDLPTEDLRRDHYYETGYGIRFYPSEKTYIGATAGLKRNDSNDIYNDYNDYEGYKINGFIYQKIGERFSVVGFAGYDYKDYTARTFLADGAVDTENDDFIYLGGYAYYDFNKNWQAFLSHLYKQNYSNDASQEYSGSTTTAGASFTF